MNGTLYRIFHIKSGKSYIGKTYQGFYVRLQQHIRDTGRFPDRPLYRALNKYGIESFSAEIIGDYEEGLLEHKEQEYVEKYDSYSNGYNATRGGDGSRYLRVTDSEIVNTYLRLNNITHTANELSIDSGSVKRVLINCGITLKSHREVMKSTSPQVRLIELELYFDSITDCVQHLKDSEIVAASTRNSSVSNSIHRVCKGERKNYMDFTFEYVQH